MRKIAVVGTGLMGTSFGLHVQSFYNDVYLLGYDKDPKQSENALKIGAFSRIVDSLTELKGCEFIFVCCPLKYASETIERLFEIVDESTIITDISSVKSQICKRFADKKNFLGGHPMTGSERQGALAAQAEIFDNSLYILCPEINQELSCKKIQIFLEKMNIKIYKMKPSIHDRVVAMASHLPYFVATTLVNSMDGELFEHISSVAGSGFRDTSRVASSPGKMWDIISKENSENILEAINIFKERLDETTVSIKKENTLDISDKAKRLRDSIVENRLAGSGESMLTIDVPDRPGVLSNIFNLLENINIKNIEIEDSREYSTGSLRVFFRTTEDKKKAEHLLKNSDIFN